MTKKVNGNTQGIRDSFIERIQALYELRMAGDEFASHELVAEVCAITGILGREISIYIARDGSIADVSVGDSSKVDMPDMRLVRNADRLCGVRCLHTHPGGDGRPSGVDLGTLRSVKLDAMASVGVGADGNGTTFYAAFLGDMQGDEREVITYGPLRPYRLPQRQLLDEIRIADEKLRTSVKDTLDEKPEKRASWDWKTMRHTIPSRNLRSLLKPQVQRSSAEKRKSDAPWTRRHTSVPAKWTSSSCWQAKRKRSFSSLTTNCPLPRSATSKLRWAGASSTGRRLF